MSENRFQNVETYLTQQTQAHLDSLVELLKIPSVSADSACQPAMKQASEMVRDLLAKAGMKSEIHETPGHPIVTGEWRGAGESAPTVLVYGHYDVQPADPLELWTTPPFEPTIRDGKIFARGATDDKGQMLTHILSVSAWMNSVGSLPVNVIFVIEGEEEVGSNHLEQFLQANREKYACDVAVISDTSMYSEDLPAITCGLRGILACEVTLTGPNRDLHSGVFGGAVANPVVALSKLVSLLHDDQGRVQIPGFYDDVQELTAEEREQIRALPFEEQDFCRDLGISESYGESGYSTLERRWTRPTCEINGLFGGYLGEGPKTIVPSYATAKITCRLVPKQNSGKLTDSLEAFLRSRLPPGVTMKFRKYHGCEGFVFDTSGSYFQSASDAVAYAFGKTPAFIREGGSIPVVATLSEVFGVETLLLGWGLNSENLHSPNEHFYLSNFHRGILASARLWDLLGESH